MKNTISLMLSFLLLLTACSVQKPAITVDVAAYTQTPVNAVITSTFHSSPRATQTPVTARTTVPTNVPSTLEAVDTQVPPTKTVEKLVPEKYYHLIGKVIPPYPDSLESSSGGLLEPLGKTDYGLKFATNAEDHILILDKLDHRDPEQAFWEILDILELPDLKGEEVFIPWGCMISGEVDAEILVIAIEDEESLSSRFVTNSKILHAWRANRAAEAFEAIPVDEIECHTDEAIYW